MSRKDYIAVAKAISDERQSSRMFPAYTDMQRLGATASLDSLADRIADVFAADNARFNRAQFLRACGTGA